MDEEKIKGMIRELADMNYKQGMHSGKWETGYDKETTAEEYLSQMQSYASYHGIPFSYNLEDNFKDKEEYEDLMEDGVEYAMDEEGARLKSLVEVKIIKEIFKEFRKG